MKEQRTALENLSIEEENNLLREAGSILEGIGNIPGITPMEFFKELDRLDINDIKRRTELLKAAASIEMMMIFDDAIIDQTTH
jgi:hypothetical protein